MQLYAAALKPRKETLHVRDIPKTPGMTQYCWGSQDISISWFKAGAGLRCLPVCPNCSQRTYEVIQYFNKHDGNTYCCKKCDPYERTPYADRTNLDDSDITALIDYHIDKQKMKLEVVGVELSTYLGDIRSVEALPTMKALLADQLAPFYPELFDYKGHLHQRPKHMKTLPFKRMLVKLKLLYDLKNEAMQYRRPVTGAMIRARTTKEMVDEFIRHDT